MTVAILWRSTPKLTRAVALALFWTSVTILIVKVKYLQNPDEQRALHDIVIPYIQLVPRYAIFYPWVFVTAIFAEISVISFLLAFGVLYVSTGYVEKFWGHREVLKFIVIVGAITNLSTVVITIVSNIFRGDVLGMDKPLGGGVSYYFGFLVVFKQLIPEHNVVLFQGLVNFRVKHLPFLLLIIVSVWSAAARTLYPVLPSVLSFFVAYNYLRFHQSFFADPLLPITSASGESSSTYFVSGDASDAFQLVEFFPSACKPYLGPVINSIYDVCVLLGIVTPFNDDAVEQSNMRVQKLSELVNQANNLLANSVAERRRQVALQVIEDRTSHA
ncbi:DUF1751-domain-containing protein [Metschnikowia bicuspidata var. bicuspidata NRRL YB-4993]|uniref:DUF1751-domain-containing protein n=1 Tax=Metschnikowia bicuspidata var. bicuspidata NRRL YB-4993 TaxID=869754 RepID=A0A1A0H8J5_9ASCO|nr:DUF1751-domain-containing protein [Metschnikowia bicuspidata var. bicuspidata NRRL YB-4993]OBA20341.1 DUF1751-domain-containing protein [Metschnikowia bicuspidata var. bicuspidata NRRL YB-4993]